MSRQIGHEEAWLAKKTAKFPRRNVSNTVPIHKHVSVSGGGPEWKSNILTAKAAEGSEAKMRLRGGRGGGL